jgi:hypothetical protein
MHSAGDRIMLAVLLWLAAAAGSAHAQWRKHKRVNIRWAVVVGGIGAVISALFLWLTR